MTRRRNREKTNFHYIPVLNKFNSPATCDDVCIFIYVFYLFYFLKIIDLVWEQLFVTSFFVDLFSIFIKNENFHYGMCYSLPYWTKKMSDYEFSSD